MNLSSLHEDSLFPISVLQLGRMNLGTSDVLQKQNS